MKLSKTDFKLQSGHDRTHSLLFSYSKAIPQKYIKIQVLNYARRLTLANICMKFHEAILQGRETRDVINATVKAQPYWKLYTYVVSSFACVSIPQKL